MTIKLENINNKILDDLNNRNDNWEYIDGELIRLETDKADKAETKVKISSVEKELNDYKSTMASVNVNQEAKQNVTGYGTISLPKNTANGQVSARLLGETRNNKFPNASLETGNNEGWEIFNDGIIVSSEKPLTGQYSVKSTRASSSSDKNNGAYINIEQNKGYTFGFYVFLITPPTTALNLRLEWYDNTNTRVGTAIFNLANLARLNQWQKVEDYKIAPQGAVKAFIGFQQVTTQAVLYYVDDFFCEEGDQIGKNYITGTKSTVSASRLKSVGKNLFDGKLELGSISTANGSNVTRNDRFRSGFIKVIPLTNIILSKDGALSLITIVEFDKNKQFIKSNSNGVATTSSNCQYVRFFTTGDSSNLKDKYQLEKGTVATPYEPHTSTTSYLPNVGELRSLPNGTKDEIRVSGGKAEKVQRVSEPYVIQASDVIAFQIVVGTYVDIVTIRAFLDFSANQSMPYAELATSKTTGRTTPSYDLETSYWKHAYDSTKKIYFYVPKGTFADLTTAKNDLAGTTLTYQLAEPIITPINVSGNLVSYPSGTVYVEQVVADAGLYTTKMDILNTDLPIKALDKLSKVDYTTGVEHSLDVSKAVVSAQSFTHPDLTMGDIVFFEYYYDLESTNGNASVEYYDSRYTVKDSVTNKFYKWSITIENGVPTIETVEV